MLKVLNKTKALTDHLRRRILAAEFKNRRMPREYDLCREYGVARITVRNALEQLDREQLIERKKRLGTFVKERPAKGGLERQVCVFMRTRGHLYSDIYHFLVQRLNERGLTANVISTTDLADTKFDLEPMTRTVERMLDAGVHKFIVDGYVYYRLPHIREILKRDSVFYDFLDAPRQPGPSPCGVWFDYRHAGYLVGRHLMDTNCRRPLWVGNRLWPSIRFNPRHYSIHREKLMIDGFRAALAESDLDDDCFILGSAYNNEAERENIIERLLCDKNVRPDGIGFGMDSMASKPLRTIMELGLRVPDDIRIVGTHNTPWSNETSLHPFSSIDMNVEALTAAVADMVVTPPEKRRPVLIKPRLMVRNNSIRPRQRLAAPATAPLSVS